MQYCLYSTQKLTPLFVNFGNDLPESLVPGLLVTGAMNDDNSWPSSKGF